MSVVLVTFTMHTIMLNIVKKGKSIIKKNEVHILKALGKNAVMLYNEKN